MDFNEILGFIITMLAFFMLFSRQLKDAKKRKEGSQDPSLETEEQDPAIKEILKSLNLEELPIENAPKTIQKSAKKKSKVHDQTEQEQVFHPEKPKVMKTKPSAMEMEHKKAFRIQKHPYKLPHELLKNTTLKDAMLLREILGPPRGISPF